MIEILLYGLPCLLALGMVLMGIGLSKACAWADRQAEASKPKEGVNE